MESARKTFGTTDTAQKPPDCLSFEQLNLNRVNSNVFDFNLRSQKMHVKIGFKQEGIRRQAKYINGAYHNVIEYGLLREDWEKTENQ